MNKLVLGTVQMGLDYGINNNSGKISFDNCCTILSKAFELGIDVLDSAEAYGDAHQIIGNFHKLNPSIKFKIITKIPHGDLVDLENRIHSYLKDLNVLNLEVLMFHSFDSYINNKPLISVLKDLKKQEFIKHIGVSIYTNTQIETLLLDDDITVVQMPFNLLDNETIRGDLMTQLKAKGKIIHTRSAFLQGLFFKESDNNNSIFTKLNKELTQIRQIVKEASTNISNLALSYCLNQNNIDQVLIGVDSVEQLNENIKAVEYKISLDTNSKINMIKVNDQDLLNPSLWK
jgi:aryl-alcohol dehydrogenase-like predicted oxidoreductase